MDRRAFLGALAAGVAATLTGCVGKTDSRPGVLETYPGRVGSIDPKGSASLRGSRPTPPGGAPRPPGTANSPAITIDRLPASSASRLALTVDDGVSSEVLDAYVDFVKTAGIRITFFVNGVRPSWTNVRTKLAPLVESGQAQLGNHTWDHPAITKLTHTEIVDQLQRNERFLANTYGVTSRPYFRPPYGFHTPWTDKLTNELGYTRTVTWYGSLGDAAVRTPTQIITEARKWFVPGRIVIGHANHPAVTHTYTQLIDIIRERQLRTVTLHDVFGEPAL